MLLNYVARKDLIKWIPKSELTKGRGARKPPSATASSLPSTPRAVIERRQSTSVSTESRRSFLSILPVVSYGSIPYRSQSKMFFQTSVEATSTPSTAGEVSSTTPSEAGPSNGGEKKEGDDKEKEVPMEDGTNGEVMDQTVSRGEALFGRGSAKKIVSREFNR